MDSKISPDKPSILLIGTIVLAIVIIGALCLTLAAGALSVYQVVTTEIVPKPVYDETQGTMPDSTAVPTPGSPNAVPAATATATDIPIATQVATPTATITPTPTGTPTAEPTLEASPTPTSTTVATATPTPVPTINPTPIPTATATPAANPFTSGTEHITPLKPEDYAKLQMTDIPVLRIGKGTIIPDETTFGQAYYYHGDTARLRVTIINLNDTITQETLTIKVATKVLGFWIDYPVDYSTNLDIELKTGEHVEQDFYVTIPQEMPPGFYRLTIDLNDRTDGQLICGVVKEINILEDSD